jgi:hypothetical protein
MTPELKTSIREEKEGLTWESYCIKDSGNERIQVYIDLIVN